MFLSWFLSSCMVKVLYKERGFSINKQLMGTNMKEESLVSEHIVYHKITSDNINTSSFVITPELQKICILVSLHYKKQLKKAKEVKVRPQQILKHKTKCEELGNIKKVERQICRQPSIMHYEIQLNKKPWVQIKTKIWVPSLKLLCC